MSKILVVDDSPIELAMIAENIQEAFKEIGEECSIHTASDGDTALELIQKETPRMILLDLNLPKKSGLAVLRILKSTETTKHIPVVFITTSQDPLDILHGWREHIAGYIVKPLDYDDYKKISQTIIKYWIELVKTIH
jgi:CheY-like chemotaxis protein